MYIFPSIGTPQPGRPSLARSLSRLGTSRIRTLPKACLPYSFAVERTYFRPVAYQYYPTAANGLRAYNPHGLAFLASGPRRLGYHYLLHSPLRMSSGGGVLPLSLWIWRICPTRHAGKAGFPEAGRPWL